MIQEALTLYEDPELKVRLTGERLKQQRRNRMALSLAPLFRLECYIGLNGERIASVNVVVASSSSSPCAMSMLSEPACPRPWHPSVTRLTTVSFFLAQRAISGWRSTTRPSRPSRRQGAWCPPWTNRGSGSLRCIRSTERQIEDDGSTDSVCCVYVQEAHLASEMASLAQKRVRKARGVPLTAHDDVASLLVAWFCFSIEQGRLREALGHVERCEQVGCL